MRASSRITIILLTFVAYMLLISPGNSVAITTRSLVVKLDGPVNGKGVPFPWSLKENKGKAHTEIATENGESVLNLYSANSSFSLQREFPVDTRKYPYIIWTWKTLRQPPNGDVRKKEKNDQALQLLVAFENRRILSYIWDANAPEGTISDESLPWPISLKVKVLVVKSGLADTGKWLTITRNIHDDYKRVFNEAPAKVKGIRIQINTQHTGEKAKALYKKIVFSRTPKVG